MSPTERAIFEKLQHAITLYLVVSWRIVVRLVAMLGGFIGRKGDGEPGVKTLWQGLQTLHQAVEIAQILGEAAQTG